MDSSTCARIPLKILGVTLRLWASQVAQREKIILPMRRCKRHRFNPQVGKIPWSRKWQPTPIFLCGKSHRQRRPVGYSPWCHKESDMSEQWSTTCMRNVPWLFSKALPWCQMYLKLQILLLVTPLAFQGQSLHSGQGIPPDARYLQTGLSPAVCYFLMAHC